MVVGVLYANMLVCLVSPVEHCTVYRCMHWGYMVANSCYGYVVLVYALGLLAMQSLLCVCITSVDIRAMD